jgi:hypothetical protein
MTITFVCGGCGSSDVSRDAWADPDVEKQEWVLRVRRRFLPDVRMPARTRGGGAISPLRSRELARVFFFCRGADSRRRPSPSHR